MNRAKGLAEILSDTYFSSNAKVLTTRIFFTGVLVGLYGADSSLPSLPNIWIIP